MRIAEAIGESLHSHHGLAQCEAEQQQQPRTETSHVIQFRSNVGDAGVCLTLTHKSHVRVVLFCQLRPVAFAGKQP